MNRLTQYGDTIVEVLISMAVISLVLGGAFVTTQRSQTGVRDSQEHAVALQLIEDQLERLRADASSQSPTVFAFVPPAAGAGNFCMASSGGAVSTSGVTAKDCVQNSSGANAAATDEPKYKLSISGASSINSSSLFTIQATWDEVSGTGQAQETMVYRLYK